MIRRLAPAQTAILATGFAVLFFGTGTRYVLGLALVPMTDDLDISRSVLSSALLMFMIVSALAMPVVGRLIDRGGIRPMMAVGAVISAAAVALTAYSQSAWHVFALYGILYAIGFAATTVAPVSVLMSRWFPNNTGLASSAAITGNGTGQLVIIILVASFLPAIGWRGAYLWLGVVNAIVVVPIILLFVRNPPSSAPAPSANPHPPNLMRTAASPRRRRALPADPRHPDDRQLLDADSHVHHLRLSGLLRRHPRRRLCPRPWGGRLLRGQHSSLHGLGRADGRPDVRRTRRQIRRRPARPSCASSCELPCSPTSPSCRIRSA